LSFVRNCKLRTANFFSPAPTNSYQFRVVLSYRSESFSSYRCSIIAVLIFAALILTPTLHAQNSAADLTLFNAANRDRAAAGLPPLKWDDALASAAHDHALKMARANALPHQLPGEPPMQDRARYAGARFSLIAENVAEGRSISGLHTQWMNSSPHRANLLDPQLNSIGISVVQSGNVYFAVQDFSTAVPSSRTTNLRAVIRARPAKRLRNRGCPQDLRARSRLGRAETSQFGAL
jgi:uncharacterized protein YkwD